MDSPISRSTVLVAVAIASLLPATPAGAQSDDHAIVAAVTNFLDGLRSRDTALVRSAVVPGATLVPVGGPTGMGAPSAIDGIIERIGKGNGPRQRRTDRNAEGADRRAACLWLDVFHSHAPWRNQNPCLWVDIFLLRKGPDGWKIFQIAATSRTEGCRAVAK